MFVLLAAGLLCLSLVPVCQAQDLDEDVDVEDDLDLGLAGTEDDEEELEGDEQDETPPATKTAAPKVSRLLAADWTDFSFYQDLFQDVFRDVVIILLSVGIRSAFISALLGELPWKQLSHINQSNQSDNRT